MGQLPKNSAIFRFYEELNDFLPARQRKKERLYIFNGYPSIKDAIEAQNIPHTEVDLILVNGNPVGFNYKLQSGDRVAVYPVFECFDIGPVKGDSGAPLRETKFIVDVHLGKLARYLRMTGFDTLYQTDMDDHEIIAIALKENRIILTRDKGILKNKLVTKGCYIRSQKPGEQLREVIRRLQLKSVIRFLSRCIACNGIISETAKKDILGDLQPGISNAFSRFFRCKDCGRIYWEGSHYARMLDYYIVLRSDLETSSNN